MMMLRYLHVHLLLIPALILLIMTGLMYRARGSGEGLSYGVASSEGKLLWSYSTGGRVYPPAVGHDGTVYIGSQDGRLYALTSKGKLKWSFAAENSIVTAPVIAPDGTVIFGDCDHKLYAITGGGKLKWKRLAGGGQPAAVGRDGTIYVVASGLYALDGNGNVKWDCKLAERPCSSPTVAADGTIYTITSSGYYGTGRLVAVTSNGTLKWESGLADPSDGSPVMGAGGIIYARICTEHLGAWDSAGIFKVRFFSRMGIHGTPCIAADGTIYCSGAALYSFAPDGRIKWQERVGLTNNSPAISSTGLIYVGSNKAGLRALRSDGSLKWSFKTGDSMCGSPAIAPDGTIYAVSLEGSLYALRGAGRLADTPWPMYRHDASHSGRAGK